MKTRSGGCGADRKEKLKDRRRKKDLFKSKDGKVKKVKKIAKRKVKKNVKTKTAAAAVDNPRIGHETETQPQPDSSQSCFLCQVKINNCDHVNQSKNENQFLKMVTRYLKLDPMNHCKNQEKPSGSGGSSKGSNNLFMGTIGKSSRRKGSNSKGKDSNLKACSSCSGIIAKLCDLCQQRDTTDLLIILQLGLLLKNMESGDKSPSSSGKQTSTSSDENGASKTGPETLEKTMMDGFRKEFRRKSIALGILGLGLSKVSLKKLENPVSSRNRTGTDNEPGIPLEATAAVANNSINKDNPENFQNPDSVSTIGEDLDEVNPEFLPTVAAAATAVPENDFPQVDQEMTNSNSTENPEDIGIATDQEDFSKDFSPETEEASPKDVIPDQEPASNSSVDTIEICGESISDPGDDNKKETSSDPGPGTASVGPRSDDDDITQFDSRTQREELSRSSASFSSSSSSSSGSPPNTSRATVINRNVGDRHDHELIDISDESGSSDDDEDDDAVCERTVSTQTSDDDEIYPDSESDAGSNSFENGNELQFQQPQNQLAIPAIREELDENEFPAELELDEYEEMEMEPVSTYDDLAPPPPPAQFQDDHEGDSLNNELRDFPSTLNLNLELDENFYYMHQGLLQQQQQQQSGGSPQSRVSGTRVNPPFMPGTSASASTSSGVYASNFPAPPPRQDNEGMMGHDYVGVEVGQHFQNSSQPQPVFMSNGASAGASSFSSSPYDFQSSPSTSSGSGSQSRYTLSPQENPIIDNNDNINNNGNGQDFPFNGYNGFNGFDSRPELNPDGIMSDGMNIMGSNARYHVSPPPPAYHSPPGGYYQSPRFSHNLPFEMEEFVVAQRPPTPPSFDCHNLMPD